MSSLECLARLGYSLGQCHRDLVRRDNQLPVRVSAEEHAISPLDEQLEVRRERHRACRGDETLRWVIIAAFVELLYSILRPCPARAG